MVRKLYSFMMGTLDGFYEGPNQEFDWPTQAAREDDPVVAELMNTMPKIVVSTTLESADWHNTTLVDGNVAEELSKLKQPPGKDLAIMGSPNLTVTSSGWAWSTSCGSW